MKLKTSDIKGKSYVEVNERIRAFRSLEQYKGYILDSDIISHENGVIIIKAFIKDANDRVVATGTAYEKEGSSFINKTSYIENCETSAWGRALGNLGIGVDTSIATYEEVANAVENQKEKPKKVKPVPIVTEDEDVSKEIEMIKQAKTMDDLKAIFVGLPTNLKNNQAIVDAKDEMKDFLAEMGNV